MALIPCPDCATEVSDRAPTCPRCGAPIAGSRPSVVQGQAVSQSRPPADEVTYYSDHQGVRITSARAIMQSRTYSMANLSSVSMWIEQPNRAGALLLAAFGLLQGLSCIGSNSMQGWSALGLICLSIGIGFLVQAKPKFWVRLTAAGGETNALFSKDREYIQTVIGALNEAIVKRG